MKSLLSLLTVCVFATLGVSTVAVSAASGDEWYECTSANPGSFKDAHCKEASSGGAGYAHVGPLSHWIPHFYSNFTTGSERSTLKMKSVQSGVTLEIQAPEVEGTGEIGNAEAWGEGRTTFVFKGVTVTAPAGKGCKVAGGSITTNKLAMTTKGLTKEIKFSPFTGETLFQLTVEGCSVAALNHAYSVTGSVKGSAIGTTTNFTHTGTTAQGTLFMFGQKLGLEGSTTLKQWFGSNGISLT